MIFSKCKNRTFVVKYCCSIKKNVDRKDKCTLCQWWLFRDFRESEAHHWGKFCYKCHAQCQFTMYMYVRRKKSKVFLLGMWVTNLCIKSKFNFCYRALRVSPVATYIYNECTCTWLYIVHFLLTGVFHQ